MLIHEHNIKYSTCNYDIISDESDMVKPVDLYALCFYDLCQLPTSTCKFFPFPFYNVTDS